jgi:drug/metabolite transporter (DMT)-like permease
MALNSYNVPYGVTVGNPVERAMKCIHQRDPRAVTTSLAILACLLWSTAFVGVKIGLRYADPFYFAGSRFMLAGLLLVPFWWKKRSTLSLNRDNIRVIFLVSFFQTFVMYGLFYLGMNMVSGALAAIMIGASPLTAAVVAHLFMANDVMTRPKLISLSLGMAGVVLLSVSRLPWQSPTGLVEFTGILLLFVCTVSSAFGNVLVAREKSDLDPVLLNSVQIFIGGFFLFLVSLCRQGLPTGILPGEYYAALLWLSFLSAVAFSLWFVLLQRPGVQVSRLNVWKFIIPVFGAIFSWLFLPDESPRILPVIGMLSIAVAIVFFNAADSGQSQ